MKNNSITKKLLTPMMCALVIQASLFAGTILKGGVLDTVNYNIFSMLDEKLNLRRGYLRSDMLKRWSNLDESVDKINSKVSSKLNEEGNTNSELDNNIEVSDKILSEVSYDLVATLRKNGVTGAFLILDNNIQSESNNKKNIEKSGLYIRDLDPTSNPGDVSDLLVEVGPSSVIREMDMTMDSRWNSTFELDNNKNSTNSDFFYKPINEAKNNKNMTSQNLGYWSKPFNLNGTKTNIITYSIPLFDSDKNPYAVLGVEISLDYLCSNLPYEDINKNGEGGYALAIDNNADMKFDKVLLNGGNFDEVFKDYKEITFETEEIYSSIYRINQNSYKIKENKKDDTIYGCVKYLDLYESNTPFENENWAIIGLISKNSLLGVSNNLKYLIGVSLIISIIIGASIVYISGNKFTMPIKKLSKNLINSDPRKTISLERINMEEIDELSIAIENLSTKVADSSSKLSQVIKLLNMPIGAFEYKYGEKSVFCTDAFFDVLCTDETYNDLSYIEKPLFDKIINNLMLRKEEDNEDIYITKDNNGKDKWIRLKTLEDKNRTLGVIIDVTEDILEKKKIEYERDHDLLTQILNRRAFFNKASKKLNENDIGIGAFFTLDLDNLKYVNDNYGHDYGDKYIQKSAIYLNELTKYNGIVGRMSGDEFIGFIYGYTKKDDIRNIIKQIFEKIKESNMILPKGHTFKMSASLGIAWYPDDSTEYENLAKYSDFAMYKVKSTEKGNINEFDLEEYEMESKVINNTMDINRVIEDELIEHEFQPIIKVSNGEIFAYEAKMYSSIDEFKNINTLIRVASHQSKLYEIERINWFKAMEKYKNNYYSKGNKIFINSMIDYTIVLNELESFELKYADCLKNIVIQLTSTNRYNEKCINKKKNLASKWGCKISIENFRVDKNGQYLSLGIIPDIVSVDEKIIREIDKSLEKKEDLEKIIFDAKRQDIEVIARGIKTNEELETVIKLGVDYIQGEYIKSGDVITKYSSKK